MKIRKKTIPNKIRESPRILVILLFCLLIASTVSTAAAAGMHNTIQEYDGAGTC
ncbi:MAG: hypothetical protein HF976_12580, partial [ANME-2 cluster archaeon]|nr:hypothetical protein [ANME-2 cluster archaeon]MBC2708199.1 hypothetical protein [ANME-2 cluster archaeon]MBC2748542.1 hypothetical protein [ANME-2 cluster archaeon]